MGDWHQAEFHADRALEMYERGRWAEAEAELRKALSLNPDQAEWHFNLGLTLEAAGRDSEAMLAYERAALLLPTELEPLLAAAITAIRIGRYEDALTWLDQALRADHSCEAAYAHKIDALVRLARYDEAETTFYLAAQMLETQSALCLSMLAEGLYAREDYERAGWCLREALKLDPGLPRLRARLGNVLAAIGRPQRALQMFLRELRDDPGNIDTLLDFGDLLMEIDRLPEASEKFRRVLELEPANVDAHYRLGEIALQQQRYEQAHVEFELVLKLDPGCPHIRLSLAEALLERGRTEDAARCLRDELDLLRGAESLEETPRTDLVRFGDLLLRAGMAEDAAEIFETACAEAPKDRRAALLRKLAVAHFEAGDRETGALISRRVLRFEPRCVEAMHNLALSALEEGRIRTAAGWIRRGLAINSHDEGLRHLRVRLWLNWLGRLIRQPFAWRRD